MTPFDFLNSINEKKSYLFTDIKADNSGEASDLDSVDRKYPPFMVNRGLSYFVDTVMLANEMNELVVVVASRIQFFYGFTPINMLLPFPPGKYTMFLLPLNVFATSLAASILLNSINAGPALLVACEINFADSDSPSALITAASLSCSDFMTSNFALSASCCAPCLASIAAVYSLPNVNAVIETSSNIM